MLSHRRANSVRARAPRLPTPPLAWFNLLYLISDLLATPDVTGLDAVLSILSLTILAFCAHRCVRDPDSARVV